MVAARWKECEDGGGMKTEGGREGGGKTRRPRGDEKLFIIP
jgi:hypothetical protein